MEIIRYSHENFQPAGALRHIFKTNMELDLKQIKKDFGFSNLDQLGECLGINKRTLLRLQNGTAGKNMTHTFKALIIFYYSIPINNRQKVLEALKILHEIESIRALISLSRKISKKD